MSGGNRFGPGGEDERARFGFQSEGSVRFSAKSPFAKERRRKEIAIVGGGEERFRAVADFAERGFAPEPMKSELKAEKKKLDQALEEGPFDEALPALQRLDAVYEQAMGKSGVMRTQPDPEQTAHLPYLNSDQLVVDKKMQKQKNKFEPATALNDAIDSKLRRSNLFGQPPLERIEPVITRATPSTNPKSSVKRAQPAERDAEALPHAEAWKQAQVEDPHGAAPTNDARTDASGSIESPTARSAIGRNTNRDVALNAYEFESPALGQAYHAVVDRIFIKRTMTPAHNLTVLVFGDLLKDVDVALQNGDENKARWLVCEFGNQYGGEWRMHPKRLSGEFQEFALKYSSSPPFPGGAMNTVLDLPEFQDGLREFGLDRTFMSGFSSTSGYLSLISEYMNLNEIIHSARRGVDPAKARFIPTGSFALAVYKELMRLTRLRHASPPEIFQEPSARADAKEAIERVRSVLDEEAYRLLLNEEAFNWDAGIDKARDQAPHLMDQALARNRWGDSAE